MTADDLAGREGDRFSALAVPLVADAVAPPRLVYGGLELGRPNGVDQAYTALYFEVAGSSDLGIVMFEGLDAIRGARGEYLPYDTSQRQSGDWVFVAEGTV